MCKSGVGFLALFGLGWWLLASSAFDGVARLVEVVVGCAVTVGLTLAARRHLPASAGARSLPTDAGGSTRSTASSGC